MIYTILLYKSMSCHLKTKQLSVNYYCVNLLTYISQFLVLRFCVPKSHKPKNWVYNICLNKTFPSSRNASPIIIQLPLFYSPLNSCSDDSNHRSLQGKSSSSAGFKSFIFISFPYFLLNFSQKTDHKLAVVPPKNFCLLPSCSSCDSASVYIT